MVVAYLLHNDNGGKPTCVSCVLCDDVPAPIRTFQKWRETDSEVPATFGPCDFHVAPQQIHNVKCEMRNNVVRWHVARENSRRLPEKIILN